MELWDAYDRKLNKVDGITLVRGEIIPDGLYHLVSEIIVKHKDGTYLLMQRDYTKRLGGKWEASAGGAALCGESSIDCAKRELYEETGIKAEAIMELGVIVNDIQKTYYVQFLCYTDCNKDSISLQKGETIAYRWVTEEELRQMNSDSLASTRMQKYLWNK
ncbi:MAG: NUDIX hydrolase [Lachnospiraceae bacterium]|nr:NUDIX hydrolase [Lachnospiraceae bacterium]